MVFKQEVIEGDCVAKMSKLKPGTAKLAVADPPYNQGMAYNDYDDNKSYDEYMDWTRSWLKQAVRVLAQDGALWIFVPDAWVSEIDCMVKREFGLTKRNHVIWFFTFGQSQQKKFSPSHCHLLYYVKDKKNFTFNADPVRVPSARQMVYKDKRQSGKGKLPDATWVLMRKELEKVCGGDMDTWLESRVCGTFQKRRKHVPNQLPVPLLTRIIESTSNRGDLVLDPFSGTGACGVACALARRNYIGYELSPTSVIHANTDIKEIRQSAEYKAGIKKKDPENG